MGRIETTCLRQNKLVVFAKKRKPFHECGIGRWGRER